MKISGCFPQEITWSNAQVGDLLFITPIHGGAMTCILVEKNKQGGWLQQLSLVSDEAEILDGAAGVSALVEEDMTIYLLGTMAAFPSGARPYNGNPFHARI